jgi:hypothetical protein
VVGDSIGPISGFDFAVVKYSPAGDRLWAYRYDGPGENTDRVAGVKMDAEGNIFVTGTSDDFFARPGLATLKLNAAGQLVWASRYVPADESGVSAAALAVDRAGDVIVAATENYNCLTLQYASEGTLFWSARYRAEEPASMIAFDVRVDARDNLLVGANLFGSGTNDAVVVKYGLYGEQAWVSRASHPAGAFHMAAMDTDAEGNTYHTGAPHNDVLTVKVGTAGSQIWSANYHSTGEFYDRGELLKTDSSGNVIMGGRSIFFGEQFTSLVKYRQNAVAGAPLVNLSPPHQLVNVGSNVTFTANATGAAPLQYQWRFTGRPLAGATNSTLTLSNVQNVNRGDYSVIVSNALAVTVSPESRLTVLVEPTASVEPASQLAFFGTQAGFSATAHGTEPFTFQWRHEGTNISGATNALLRLTNLFASDAGGYSTVVSNVAGSVTSSIVSLIISDAAEQLQAMRYNGLQNGTDENPLLHITASGEKILVATSEGLETGVDMNCCGLHHSTTPAPKTTCLRTSRWTWPATFTSQVPQEDVLTIALSRPSNMTLTVTSFGRGTFARPTTSIVLRHRWRLIHWAV